MKPITLGFESWLRRHRQTIAIGLTVAALLLPLNVHAKAPPLIDPPDISRTPRH